MAFDLGEMLSGLDDIGTAIQSAVRPAAQAGAQVFYDEVKIRVPVSDQSHYFYGTSYKKTGQRYLFAAGALRDAIYQVYSKDNSTPVRATYHISWNFSEVPYGFMVEYGTSRAAAHPFLRPSYDAKKQLALEAAKAEMITRVAPVVGAA